MTLENLIVKLQAFEKVLGGQFQVLLVSLDDGKAKYSGYDLNVGLGYDDELEKVKCIFLGDQDDFDWLNPENNGKSQ